MVVLEGAGEVHGVYFSFMCRPGQSPLPNWSELLSDRVTFMICGRLSNLVSGMVSFFFRFLEIIRDELSNTVTVYQANTNHK